MPADVVDAAGRSLTLAEQLELACLLEATSRKAGNVHPARSFADLTHANFVRAAEVSSPWLARAAELGVGRAVCEAVRATQGACGSNVNLGLCLVLAPLAAVPRRQSLKRGVPRVLSATTVADAVAVYEAIRLCAPGGMGQVAEEDVAGQPTQTLREVMRPAVTRDFIAREYVQGFSFLARQAVPWFREAATRDDEAERSALWGPGGHPAVPAWEFAIVRTHVLLMANGCETLIRRKCGEGVYFDAMSRAAQIRDAGGLLSPASVAAFADFDRWLRADGHRRNPGTTADLIAGVLFWAIRERLWTPPSKAEVLVHGRAIAAGEMGPDG